MDIRTALPAAPELVASAGFSTHLLMDLSLLSCLLEVSCTTDSDPPQCLLQTCKYGSAALVQKISVRTKLALRANPGFRRL